MARGFGKVLNNPFYITRLPDGCQERDSHGGSSHPVPFGFVMSVFYKSGIMVNRPRTLNVSPQASLKT